MANEVKDLKSQLDRMSNDSRRDQKDLSRALGGAADTLRGRKTEEKLRYSQRRGPHRAVGVAQLDRAADRVRTSPISVSGCNRRSRPRRTATASDSRRRPPTRRATLCADSSRWTSACGSAPSRAVRLVRQGAPIRVVAYSKDSQGNKAKVNRQQGERGQGQAQGQQGQKGQGQNRASKDNRAKMARNRVNKDSAVRGRARATGSAGSRAKQGQQGQQGQRKARAAGAGPEWTAGATGSTRAGWPRSGPRTAAGQRLGARQRQARLAANERWHGRSAESERRAGRRRAERTSLRPTTRSNSAAKRSSVSPTRRRCAPNCSGRGLATKELDQAIDNLRQLTNAHTLEDTARLDGPAREDHRGLQGFRIRPSP